jgi:type IV pilus assembly protein PilE
MKSPAFSRSSGTAPRGFTLIELMITVVIVAILAAVAYPSFMDSVRKGRRSEAFAALTAVQQAQERWRSNRATYAGSVSNAATDTETPGLGMSFTAPDRYYDIAIVGSASATGYEVVATGVAGKSQADDSACRRLGIRLSGGALTYAGCGSAATCTLSYAATHACWPR